MSTELRKTNTKTYGGDGRLHSTELSHDETPDIEVQPRQKTADYSKPVLVRQLTVNSNQVQRPFEHCYIRIDYSLYIATKGARSQNRIADAKKAEEALKCVFDAFGAELSDVVAKTKAMIEEKVPADCRGIQYDHKRTFTVPVRTGFSTRFLNLTQMLDQLAANAEVLEINNVLAPQEADETVQSWVSRYRRFCRSINAIRSASYEQKQPAVENSTQEVAK